MLALNWPWWVLLLILGVEAWPAVLGAAVGFLILSALTRGWLRWVAALAAVPCLAVIAVAAWWAIDAEHRDHQAVEMEARTREVLLREQVVDGIRLPAGTDIQWWDVDHRKLRTANPPEPITIFGMSVTWIGLADDGNGWDFQLAEAQPVDGWTCERIGVGVSPTGQLRSCRLAAGRIWQGWPIPADSLVDLTTKGKVGLALPIGASLAAPEIGHPLTATGGFAFNADGSLDSFYFEDQDPLLVAGRRLWNTVQWTYDPATYGQGRRRRALTVRGSLTSQDNSAGGAVVIRLADGRVTSAP